MSPTPMAAQPAAGRDTAALPRVTVATVVFNGAGQIARTLDSILAQDYPELELVVVDGQSRDGTQAIVAGYGERVQRFVSEKDRGIYDGMNKALALASGELILFMNCGDVFAQPQALSALVAQWQPGEPQCLFGQWWRDAGQGEPIACAPDLAAGRFNHQSVLYSRQLHERFGGYVQAPGFTTADYLFFATLLASPVRRVVVDHKVATIDVRGVSAGVQTLGQKFAIDWLLGRTSRLRLVAVLVLHPAYRKVKQWLGRVS